MVPRMGFEDVALQIAQHVLIVSALGVNGPFAKIYGHGVSSWIYQCSVGGMGRLRHPSQRRFGAAQPERHIHIAEKLDCSRQFETRWRSLVEPIVQSAKAAVGQQGTQAKRLGQRLGLVISHGGSLAL
jgi:hypothetical protein